MINNDVLDMTHFTDPDAGEAEKEVASAFSIRKEEVKNTLTKVLNDSKAAAYKDQPKEILDHAKSGRHAGRYTAVNLTNADTVEFRMFRGTLKRNTLIATLELLDCIIDAAIYLTDDNLKAMSWSSFVIGCTQPELMQYLKERRLYVNEPVESEAEV